LDAHLGRIAAVNPSVNAVTNLHPKLHRKDEGSDAPMPYKRPEYRGRSEEGKLTWQKSA
jgi:hypothetical protein